MSRRTRQQLTSMLRDNQIRPNGTTTEALTYVNRLSIRIPTVEPAAFRATLFARASGLMGTGSLLSMG